LKNILAMNKNTILKVKVHTDGASRGNPGPAAIGLVIKNEKGEKIKSYSECLGETTNNEAEYRAAIFALKKIRQLFSKKQAKEMEVEIVSDSELMVSQLQGKYKIVNQKIAEFFIQIWNLKTDFKKVSFRLVPREENKEADRLANEALDKEGEQKLIK
jgi:ribonuclease HI